MKWSPFIGLCAVLAIAAAPVQAAPKADLWPRWTEHDSDSNETIDHSAWPRFIDQYRSMGPDGVARIDYAAVSSADRERLSDYVQSLTDEPISEYSRPVQFAYWVNLYNALTIDVVLDHYPVDTIRDIDISPGWLSDGPWGKKLVEIEGEELSLNDIEHRILRPIWEDPRIHYAVNCASIGCPNLQPVAFNADNSERLLARGARTHVNDPRGVAFVDGELVVSSIYSWFQADFGGDQQGVIDHLRAYADGDLAERLERRKGYDRHRYDWSLNDVAE